MLHNIHPGPFDPHTGELQLNHQVNITLNQLVIKFEAPVGVVKKLHSISPICLERAGLQCLLSVLWVITKTKQNDQPSTKIKKKISRNKIFFDENRQKIMYLFVMHFIITFSFELPES